MVLGHEVYQIAFCQLCTSDDVKVSFSEFLPLVRKKDGAAQIQDCFVGRILVVFNY
jgi:hypothetical protein